MEENKKLNPFVRIRGNVQRGEEVIEELKKRGGENYFDYIGDDPTLWYHITAEGQIVRTDETNPNSFFLSNYEEVKLPRWRAEEGEYYWYINTYEWGEAYYVSDIDDRQVVADRRWDCGNYFSTKEEARAKAEAVNEVLRGDNKL